MVGAIIQARMTSSRLPGKILLKVMGRPIISYLLERLRFCRRVDEIVLATTINDADDALISAVEKENILIYRGSENDVLDRYYQAAKAHHIDHIMRITADCPLIDPQLCDHVVEIYQQSEVEFAFLGPTFAEGLDCAVFSFQALEKAWREARLKSEREHVTPYLHNHPEYFRKVDIQNDQDDSHYRITVDEESDFQVVKEILLNLYRNGEYPFLINEIKTFLDSHPEIFNLNAHIIRNEGLLKSLKEDENVR
jgi:spore coat polysaccharide biosynthesis protein SpsF